MVIRPKHVAVTKYNFVNRLYTTSIKCIITLLSLHVSALLGHHQVTNVYNYDINFFTSYSFTQQDMIICPKELSRHISVFTWRDSEKMRNNLSKDSRCPSRVSDQAPPIYVSKGLSLCQLTQVEVGFVTNGRSASLSWCRAPKLIFFMIEQLLSLFMSSLTRGRVSCLHFNHSLIRVAQNP
jgi:hypothetical protein